MQDYGVELVLLNGGDIRGMAGPGSEKIGRIQHQNMAGVKEIIQLMLDNVAFNMFI